MYVFGGIDVLENIREYIRRTVDLGVEEVEYSDGTFVATASADLHQAYKRNHGIVGNHVITPSEETYSIKFSDGEEISVANYNQAELFGRVTNIQIAN